MDFATSKPSVTRGAKVAEKAGGDLESARIGGQQPRIGSDEAGTFAGSAVWAYSCPCGWSIRSIFRRHFESLIVLHDESHSIELVALVDGDPER